MILGLGTDCIEIERVKKACEREAFFLRVYTENERAAFCDSPAALAGNFAVKGAVAKVFGTGFCGVSPAEIEVLRDGLGKPYVVLYERAKRKALELGIARLHVSISNTRTLALAVAVGEGEKAKQ